MAQNASYIILLWILFHISLYTHLDPFCRSVHVGIPDKWKLIVWITEVYTSFYDWLQHGISFCTHDTRNWLRSCVMEMLIFRHRCTLCTEGHVYRHPSHDTVAIEIIIMLTNAAIWLVEDGYLNTIHLHVYIPTRFCHGNDSTVPMI